LTPGVSTYRAVQICAATSPGPGLIEIDIGAARVRVRGAVDEANLRCVLQALGAQP